MVHQTCGVQVPSPLISRRRFTWIAGGSALVAIAGCSGSEDDAVLGDELHLKRFTGSSTNASMILERGPNESLALWTDSSTGRLQQALFISAGRRYRVFYGIDNQVTGVREENSGDVLIVSSVSSVRKDYNQYDKNGAWKSGWAVVLGEGGGIVGASILSAPVIQSGAVLPGNLGERKVLFKTTALLAQSQGAPRVARLIDLLVSSAHAQSSSGSFGQAVAGAFIATAGAVVFAGAATTAAALIGAAAVATGVYVAGSAIANSQNLNMDGIKNQIDSIINNDVSKSIGDSLTSWANQKNPVESFNNRVSEYINKGGDALSAASSLGSVAAGMQNTAVAASSGLISVADNLLASLNQDGGTPPSNSPPMNPNPTNPGEVFVPPSYCIPAPC